MSKHTPTPWWKSELNSMSINDEQNPRSFSTLIGQMNGKERKESDANRARVIACVNAFHSPDGREIATEKISEGLVWELHRFVWWISQELCECEETPLDCLPCFPCEARALLAKLEE